MTTVTRSLLFVGYCLAVSLAQWPVVSALYDYSRRDDTASHLVLIPFVTFGLMFLDRGAILATARTAWREGLLVMGAGVALLGMSHILSTPESPGPSLIPAVAAIAVLWSGGFLLFFGRGALRIALFPLAFLVFMVPIPQVLVDASIQFLKDGSTAATAALFKLTGTTFFREGYIFALPTVTIEVADACSGIRSSIALVLTSLLAGHMYLRAGWTKALIVLFVVPLSILKNAIRIVTLSLMAIHVDPAYLTGQLHHDGGFVFFVLSLLIGAPILVLLRRWERSGPDSLPQQGHAAAV